MIKKKKKIEVNSLLSLKSITKILKGEHESNLFHKMIKKGLKSTQPTTINSKKIKAWSKEREMGRKPRGKNHKP